MLFTEISKQDIESYLKNVTNNIYINGELYAVNKEVIEIYAGDATIGNHTQNEYYTLNNGKKVLESIEVLESTETTLTRYADDVLDDGAKYLNLPDDGRGWSFIFNKITLLDIHNTEDRFPGTQLFVAYE